MNAMKAKVNIGIIMVLAATAACDVMVFSCNFGGGAAEDQINDGGGSQIGDNGHADPDAGIGDTGADAQPFDAAVDAGTPDVGMDAGTHVDAGPTHGFLSVQGQQIVDEHGVPVTLRGLHVGSWLSIETWISGIGPGWSEIYTSMLAMVPDPDARLRLKNRVLNEVDLGSPTAEADFLRICGEELGDTGLCQEIVDYWKTHPPVQDERGISTVLQTRFGQSGMMDLRDAYRRAWVSEDDFRVIAAAGGVNLLRIPFWWALLEEDGNPYSYSERGFSHLDNALDWCARHGFYCVLDLHGAPGGQNDTQHSGEIGRNELWVNAEFQNRTVELLREVAGRYRDRPEVAGYDLLNEPMGAPSMAALFTLYGRIYEAIRSVDERHIVIVEDGYMGLDKMPDPATLGV
ncbi:MAG: cellulase family glycosylhydrolase [Deltaproteobacteria bacterium]|nr:cellulase family glycosylhydrolase [Deltaproteobacteria bacterium]